MPRRAVWLRFAVEALFLILVAVGAGILELERLQIVFVMAGAWLLVALVEWTFSRRAQARRAAEPATVTAELEPARDALPRHVEVVTPAEEAEAEPVVEEEPVPAALEEEPALPTLEEEPPTLEAVVWGPVVEAEAGELAEPEEAVAVESEPPLAGVLAEPGEVPAVEIQPDLAEVRAPEPEPEPVAASEPQPEPEARPAEPPAREPAPVEAGGPREWNLWDLERLARENSGDDAVRDEEWSFLLMYLRDFAGPDGVLPVDFDELVRDSFGPVLAAAR